MSDKLKFYPLDDRVLVQQDAAETQSPGGIVLPENALRKPRRGTILRCGPGKLLSDGKRAKMQLKEKDVVYFANYAGNQIEIEGEEFYVMNEHDVLGVLR